MKIRVKSVYIINFINPTIMKKISLLLLSLAVAMCAAASVMSLPTTHHHFKANKVAGPCLTQDALNELMATPNAGVKRVINTMPEGSASVPPGIFALIENL